MLIFLHHLSYMIGIFASVTAEELKSNQDNNDLDLKVRGYSWC